MHCSVDVPLCHFVVLFGFCSIKLCARSNHEVILPFRTSSYNDGKESDDNEAQIAMCTLRSFPYLPKHCIEFAKQAYFSD
jgi:hypothetical protein